MGRTALDPADDVAAALLAAPVPDELGPAPLLHAGRALAWGTLALEGHPTAATEADRSLTLAFDHADAVPLPTGLHGGLVGLAWIAHHLHGIGVLAEPDTSDLDDALLDGLEASWPCHDLVRGLAGVGTYALEHSDPGFAERCLRRVLTQLGRSAWFTGADALNEAQRQAHPDGGFDLGVAHGTAGGIGLLARCADAGYDVSELLGVRARWLVGQIRDDRLPAVVDRRGATSPALDAWCYGAPGAALPLLAAGRVLGDPGIEAAALGLLRAVAGRVEDRTVRLDPTCAGLCHGWAGVGHLLDQAFRATGDPALASAARRCLAEARRIVVPDTADAWPTAAASGVALALLSAESARPPTWDRLLSTSLTRGPR